MARTRWPSGPVNPGLLPRPGRSDRHRRWVPNTGARPTDRYQDNQAASADSQVRPGPSPRPYAHITAKPRKQGRSTIHILPADYERLETLSVQPVRARRLSRSVRRAAVFRVADGTASANRPVKPGAQYHEAGRDHRPLLARYGVAPASIAAPGNPAWQVRVRPVGRLEARSVLCRRSAGRLSERRDGWPGRRTRGRR